MYKELIISIIIIAVIVAGNIITHNYLSDSIENMKGSLNNLEKVVLSENENDIEVSMRNIEILWKSLYKKLSFFIEHDELEKVEIRIANMNGNAKVKEYKQMMQYIDECEFVLDHIKNKESLYWENIF